MVAMVVTAQRDGSLWKGDGDGDEEEIKMWLNNEEKAFVWSMFDAC